MKSFVKSNILCLGIAASVAMTSCSMMTDKNDDCPSGLYVRFVYDYNIQRADMFKDHCGHVTLYVYNDKGEMVARKAVSNSADEQPLAQYGYAVHFADGELPDGNYRLQAVAMQKDWDEALATPGAKHRRSDVASHTDLTVALDHSDDFETGTSHYSVASHAPLDTLWHTLKVMSESPIDGRKMADIHRSVKPYSVYPLEEQFVSVKRGLATYATVSLIRDTKHLNITLRDIDHPDLMDADDYEVVILDDNSHLAHDNEVVRRDSLSYRPYSSWTTEMKNGGFVYTSRSDEPSNIQRAAHYNIMFNRLMFAAGSEPSAILVLRKKEDKKSIARINLPYTLAEGRRAYDNLAYTPQEYLDREYDYQLDFLLKDGKWKYIDIVVNILSWSKRIQNVEI